MDPRGRRDDETAEIGFANFRVSGRANSPDLPMISGFFSAVPPIYSAVPRRRGFVIKHHDINGLRATYLVESGMESGFPLQISREQGNPTAPHHSATKLFSR
jgi:hypothetical protein